MATNYRIRYGTRSVNGWLELFIDGVMAEYGVCDNRLIREDMIRTVETKDQVASAIAAGGTVSWQFGEAYNQFVLLYAFKGERFFGKDPYGHDVVCDFVDNKLRVHFRGDQTW